MMNRALLSAVALCFLAAGCQPKKEEPAQPKVADKVVPVPSAAPTAPPASGSQDAPKAKLEAAALGCTQGNCKVWMDVLGPTGAGNPATGDPDCKISKQPDTLYVWKGNQNDTINFMLRSSDWSFDANGISFTTGNITCTADANPKKYTCRNPNGAAQAGTHYYTVRVKHSNGKSCTKDPSVVNGVDSAQAAPMSEPAAI
jgi:hypothetical protein